MSNVLRPNATPMALTMQHVMHLALIGYIVLEGIWMFGVKRSSCY